jgi:hypothetical protein
MLSARGSGRSESNSASPLRASIDGRPAQLMPGSSITVGKRETLAEIRAAEADPAHRSITGKRFRRLFNEIERLRQQVTSLQQQLSLSSQSRKGSGPAIGVARGRNRFPLRRPHSYPFCAGSGLFVQNGLSVQSHSGSRQTPPGHNERGIRYKRPEGLRRRVAKTMWWR